MRRCGIKGLKSTPVDLGVPGTFAWETKHVGWPWWVSVLLWFKRMKWCGDDRIEYGVKTLFGVHYFIEARLRKP
jgi:hypothetical protein